MRVLSLKRALRGTSKAVVEQIMDMTSSPMRVEDAEGHVLIGDVAAAGQTVDVVADGAVIGRVVASERAGEVARLVAWIFEREVEKRNLATETLERYKELTLLYDLGEKLSRQLEVEDVALAVLSDAQRYLKATGGAVYLLDSQRGILQAASSVGDDLVPDALPAGEGVESQVLATGRAMFVGAGADGTFSPDMDSMALICAPLRVGERVFGVLRLWQAEGSWNAGDLKLVAALAANASSAISAAQLHARRVRELALLSQLERHVSPGLMEACFASGTEGERVVVVACCDPRSLLSSQRPEGSVHLADAVESGTVRAMAAFLDGGAVVDTPQGIVLGLFTGERCCERAIEASKRAIADIQSADPRGTGVTLPGVGIARVAFSGDQAASMYACINSAAVLQTDTSGCVVVEESVASALPEGEALPLGPREIPLGTRNVFEVNP